MASATPGPAWPPQASHPLGLPLLPPLPLHPPLHLSPLGRSPGRWGDDSDSRDQALGVRPDHAGADSPAVLADDDTQLPFHLLAPGGAAEVLYSALSAALQERMEMS